VHKNQEEGINSLDCVLCRRNEAHDQCKIEKRTKLQKKRTTLSNQTINSKSGKFSCETCPFKTHFKYRFLNHKRINHKEGNNELSGSNKLLDEETHTSAEDIAMFLCEKCDFQTERKDTLTHHTNNVHLELKRFKCSHCDYKSYYRFHIKSHMGRHHTNLEHRTLVIGCDKCESGILHKICTNGEMTFQVRRGTSPQSVDGNKCRMCLFKITNKSGMIEHFKINHIGFSVYACGSCDYGSNWISNLTNHKASVHDMEVFDCDKCEYSSKWKVPFLEHRRETHGIFLRKTKFSGPGLGETLCDMCGFSAPTLKSLKYHHMKKHDNKKTKCKFCEYKATTDFNLRTHVKYKHTLGPNSFKCDLCNYATTFPGNLKTHKKGKHADS
jgi:hypothetical protein